jgi:SAM-dependent methyltransferase
VTSSVVRLATRGSGTAAAAVLTALGVAALWWRKHPSACPYGQRFWIEAPHPLISRRRLRGVLDPAPGERILEVGPGTGYYSLDVASSLGPFGTLHVYDLQQEMLDHTLRRAHERGITNVVPALGDARTLPYPDASFDGAFLIAVLGEISDQDAALRELARVLEPGGRLVVGELFGDPHWIRPKRLERRAHAAGLGSPARFGTPLGYFMRLERPR